MRKSSIKWLIISVLMIFGARVWSLYDVAQEKFIQISARSSVEGVAQIYYNLGQGLTEKNSARNDINDINDGVSLNVYWFPIPTATIHGLRFDPLMSGGHMEIGQFRIVDGLGNVIKEFDLQKLRPAQQIDRFVVGPRHLSLWMSADANDPQLEISMAEPLLLKQFHKTFLIRQLRDLLTMALLACFLYLRVNWRNAEHIKKWVGCCLYPWRVHPLSLSEGAKNTKLIILLHVIVSYVFWIFLALCCVSFMKDFLFKILPGFTFIFVHYLVHGWNLTIVFVNHLVLTILNNLQSFSLLVSIIVCLFWYYRKRSLPSVIFLGSAALLLAFTYDKTYLVNMNDLNISNYLFITATLLMLIISVLPTKKLIQIWGIIFWALVSLETIFNNIVWKLSGSGFNESIPFHIKFGIKGAGISDFNKIIIFFLITVSILITCVIHGYFLTKNRKSSNKLIFLIFIQVVCFFSHPLPSDIFKTYYHRDVETLKFNDYFVPTNVEDISRPEQSFNLVWIYAESFEKSFFNENLFPGLLPNLSRLENQSLSFTNIHRVYGTGWTIAGFVSSQCGIPLATMGLGGNDLSMMNYFLPKAVCVSDILNILNYELVFMLGSSAEFAGTGKFFETHKFKVLDFASLEGKVDAEKGRTSWGIHDDALFSLAKNKFVELYADKKPFVLMISTMDTHHPDGFIPIKYKDMRYKDGTNRLLNAFHYSDFIIHKFVKDIKDADTHNNTIIVISSDHLSMSDSVSESLDLRDRREMFMIYFPNRIETRKINRKGTSFDQGITVLDLMGIDIKKLGLGVSLVRNDKTLYESANDHIDQVLKSWEKYLNELWG